MSRGNVHIGIHLDDKMGSVVAVRVEDNVRTFVAWDQWDLEPGLITRGLIQSELLLCQKIQMFLDAHHINPDTTCMTLGWHASRVRVSVMEDRVVEKRIEQDLERYRPFGQDNTLADTSRYTVTYQGQDQQVVLQGMMNRACSDACLLVSEKTHLGKITVMPATVPFLRTLSSVESTDGSHQVVILLDSVSGCVCLTNQHKPVFCQNLTVGAFDLLETPDAITWFMDELQPVLDYARSLSDSPLSLKVAVNGDKREVYGIETLLQKHLQSVPVQALTGEDLLVGMGMQSEEDTKDIPIFALASALSDTLPACDIVRLDLVSKESKTQIRAQKQLTYTAEVMVALVLLIALSVIPVKVKMHSVRAESQAIETQAEHNQKLGKQIEWVKAKIDSVNKEMTQYETLYKSMTDLNWPEVFSEITGIVPLGVRLVDIKTVDTGEMILIGEATHEQDVHRFAEQLTLCTRVDQVEVREIEYDKNHENLVDYDIKVVIRN